MERDQKKKFKLAILISHPIQYHAPYFKYLASQPDIDLTVYFCSRWGVEEKVDPGYGKKFKWDIPLLEGYKSIFLKNYSLSPGPTFFGQINPGIIDELKKNKYDAVVIHGYVALTNWIAFFACFIMRIPVFLKGEADANKKISSAKRVVKKIILGSLFKKISAFLYSYTLNKKFYESYDVPEEKLFFHPCSVDNNFFAEKAEELGSDKINLRRELGVKNPELPAALFVGRFVERKRVRDLILAGKDQKEFNIFLVGDGPDRKKLELLAQKERIENIHFFGFKNQSELPLFFAASDVLVLPSSEDPSPKTINEAMNFGLPTIASSSVGTAPDLVLDGKTGFTYPVGNIERLAGRIRKVLDSTQLREEMSKNSKELLSVWNFDGMVRGVLKALEYVKK